MSEGILDKGMVHSWGVSRVYRIKLRRRQRETRGAVLAHGLAAKPRHPSVRSVSDYDEELSGSKKVRPVPKIGRAFAIKEKCGIVS